MSIYQEAFGPYAPHTDPDAAVKFCLQALALDNRLAALADVLKEGSRVSGIGGEPGWELERRDDADRTEDFADWPTGARFRAFVDPGEFELGTPEGFYTRAALLGFVEAIVHAYLACHPNQSSRLEPVIAILRGGDSYNGVMDTHAIKP